MKTINIPVKSLEVLAEMLYTGRESPSAAAFACGAVHTAITILILAKGEEKNEIVRDEH